MIITLEYYTVKCDNCGELYSDEYNGYSAWADEIGALEYATESEWINEGEFHYCPDCYHYDDEDALVLKKQNNQ